MKWKAIQTGYDQKLNMSFNYLWPSVDGVLPRKKFEDLSSKKFRFHMLYVTCYLKRTHRIMLEIRNETFSRAQNIYEKRTVIFPVESDPRLYSNNRLVWHFFCLHWNPDEKENPARYKKTPWEQARIKSIYSCYIKPYTIPNKMYLAERKFPFIQAGLFNSPTVPTFFV